MNWRVPFCNFQDRAAAYWTSHGMAPRQIIIGVPTYGRGWRLNDVQKTEIGSPGRAANITKYIGEPGIAAFYEVSGK